MTVRVLRAVLVALSVAACGGKSTLLTVEVQADRTVPDGLERLCLTARDPTAAPLALGYDGGGARFGDAPLPALPATILFEDASNAFEELVVTGIGTWKGLPAGFGAGRFAIVRDEERTVTLRVHACGPNRVVPFTIEGPVAALDPTNAGERRAILADLDADGRAELIEAPARVVLLSDEEPQDITSNFLVELPISEHTPTVVTAGDLDHDCAPDILFANASEVLAPFVSAPDGVAAFQARGRDARVGWPAVGGGAIAIGDVDGSGAADVFVSGPSGYHVLRANAPEAGSVDFDDEPAYVTTLEAPDGAGTAVALADVTGDGLLDAIVGHEGMADARHAVRVFEGRDETLGEVVDALPLSDGRAVAALAVGPLDGDQTPDVLVVLRGPGPVAALWTHVADRTQPRFERAASPTFPSGDGRDAALVDLDGDCDLDVVLAVADGASLVFEQTRDGLVRKAIELPAATAVAAGPSALGPDAVLEMVVVLLDDEGGGAIYRVR